MMPLRNIDYVDILCRHMTLKTCSKGVIRREAIVSLLTSDSFLPASLVLGYSLNKYNASIGRDMILLIPIGAINDTRHIAMLRAIGWTLMYVKRVPFPDKVHPRLVDGLVKLYAWKLTQYDIIATLDADTMLTGSIEEPFEQMYKNSSIQMLAVDALMIIRKYSKEGNVYFNAGVLFFRPNIHHFNELMRLSTNKSYYNLTFPQQNLLNTYFQGQWIGLPMAFHMYYQLERSHPLWLANKNNSRIVHYAGPYKPWYVKNNKKEVELDTDLIWYRYFANVIYENGWKKQDFLVPSASDELQQFIIRSDSITRIKDRW
jgi:hypothetical protein